MTAHFKHNNYTTTITGEPSLVKEWIGDTIKKYRLIEVNPNQNEVREGIVRKWTNGEEVLLTNFKEIWERLVHFFKKDPQDLGRVIDEVNPINEWVIGFSYATRKYDGTACAIIGGELYKRYDAKNGKPAPVGAIPCQEPDVKSGHHPHWIKCSREDNANKYHFEAFDNMTNKIDGTYELCGEKIQGNPENITGHKLIKHGTTVYNLKDYSFKGIREFLENNDIEGIVFHHVTDDRMCKIRKTDFGLKRRKWK